MPSRQPTPWLGVLIEKRVRGSSKHFHLSYPKSDKFTRKYTDLKNISTHIPFNIT